MKYMLLRNRQAQIWLIPETACAALAAPFLRQNQISVEVDDKEYMGGWETRFPTA